jgi:hypothetical protein
VPRRRVVVLALGLAATLAVVPSAAPQDPAGDGVPTHYWPHRTFFFPVVVDRILQLDRQPTHLQLYSSVDRGPWQAGPRHPVNALESLDDGLKGFKFTAVRDGEHEFAVQFVYADGSVSPRTDELSPEKRVVIDTTPPTVRIRADRNGVEWVASDDYLDPQGVTLECRRVGSNQWIKVTQRAPFRPADSYHWALRPGDALEVRVKATDRAGHEGVSPVVRVPGDGAPGVGVGRTQPDWLGGTGGRPGDPLTAPGTGAPAVGAVPQPNIYYVNTLTFDVDYTIQRMGRSGVRAAHLFVIREQGDWKPAKGSPFEVNLMPSDRDQTLSLKYTADQEGLYGFYVIPESGAGLRAPDPRKGDQPMVLVEVDTSKPHCKIEGVRVTPGGARGPLVEITWRAEDRNLMPQPVSLEYSLDKGAPQWREIKYRLDNNLTKETGRYVWEVPDTELWKFWVRVRATDKAGNTGEDMWDREVVIDLTTPAAGVQGVRPGDPAAGPGSAPNLRVTPRPDRQPQGPVEKSPEKSPGNPAIPPLPTAPPPKGTD